MNSDEGLDRLFRTARSHNGWTSAPVSDEELHRLYDLLKWGPTSANSCPARFLFVCSQEAKQRLRPHLNATNVEKTMSAPVTAIVGYDLLFHEHLWDGSSARKIAKLRKSPHSATARCRGRISFWLQERSGSIAGRCRDSTAKASTASSGAARRCAPTSCAIWGTAIRRRCSRDCRVWRLSRLARLSESVTLTATLLIDLRRSVECRRPFAAMAP